MLDRGQDTEQQLSVILWHDAHVLGSHLHLFPSVKLCCEGGICLCCCCWRVIYCFSQLFCIIFKQHLCRRERSKLSQLKFYPSDRHKQVHLTDARVLVAVFPWQFVAVFAKAIFLTFSHNTITICRYFNWTEETSCKILQELSLPFFVTLVKNGYFLFNYLEYEWKMSSSVQL